MTTYTDRNNLGKSEAADLYQATRTDNNANWDAVDAALAKCNFAGGAVDPDEDNDEGEGYSIDSKWHTDTAIWECRDATEGAAIWEQTWPALAADLSGTLDHGTALTGLGDDDHTIYLLAAGTRGLSAAWDAGSWQIRAETFQSDIATGTAPLTVASTTVVANLHAANSDAFNSLADTAFVKHSLADAESDFLVASGADTFVKKTLAETKTILGIGAAGVAFWTAVPGTPTRVSNTSFKVTDTGNANLYNLQFSPGTIIKWEKSGGGFQCAKITAASYAANEVTYTIIGNTLAADFTDMKYCIHRAMKDVFIVPSTLPRNTATVDIGKTIYPYDAIYIFSALVRYKTAATTTGGVWDINDDGASIFTTKPPIAAAATKGTETVCNCLLAAATTAVAADSLVTLDYDSGDATTPGADAYVEIWFFPVAWRYLS